MSNHPLQQADADDRLRIIFAMLCDIPVSDQKGEKGGERTHTYVWRFLSKSSTVCRHKMNMKIIRAPISVGSQEPAGDFPKMNPP